MDGTLRKGQRIRLMAAGKEFTRDAARRARAAARSRSPSSDPARSASSSAAIKEVADTRIGDTVTDAERPARRAAARASSRSSRWCSAGSIRPTPREYDALRDAVEKLRLNDSSFTYEPETSLALGFGFRCGFLGLLHMEIIQERLEREFGLALITTAPTVAYRVVQTDGEAIVIDSPAKLPPPHAGRAHRGAVHPRHDPPARRSSSATSSQLCQDRRGEQTRAASSSARRAPCSTYELPLAEIVLDFYDKLKSLSRGLRLDGLRVPRLPARRTW